MSFPAGSIEFLTVSVEFCRFVENAREMESSDLKTKLQRLLSLLYFKALMVDLPDFNPHEDDEYEVDDFIDEFAYNNVHSSLHDILGDCDGYVALAPENNDIYDGDTAAFTVSEDIADVYQSIGNFAYAAKQGDEDLMIEALRKCIADFRFYWGARLLSALTALHKTIAN